MKRTAGLPTGVEFANATVVRNHPVLSDFDLRSTNWSSTMVSLAMRSTSENHETDEVMFPSSSAPPMLPWRAERVLSAKASTFPLARVPIRLPSRLRGQEQPHGGFSCVSPYACHHAIKRYAGQGRGLCSLSALLWTNSSSLQ